MSRYRRRILAGWGNYPRLSVDLYRPGNIAGLNALMSERRTMIGRGTGLSGGDAALSVDGATVSFDRLDRFVEFDPEKGILTCEAGVRLEEILSVCVPRGWFPPVVPDTCQPTLGGCVACDIHGRNQHRDGSLSRHLLELKLLLADGSRVVCSPARNRKLFLATAGGMGLTGLILGITLRLRRIETAYIRQYRQRTGNLSETIELLARSGPRHRYTMAWLDGFASGGNLGRGIIWTGDHATRESLPAGLAGEPLHFRTGTGMPVPEGMPGWLVARPVLRALNNRFYRRVPATGQRSVVGCDRFLFPLDRVRHWNRLYGRQGMLQYQCVLPPAEGEDGVRELLENCLAARQEPRLATLKIFGPQEGLLSFPMAGISLALDFPAGPAVEKMFNIFDRIVSRRGGRVYLAKDARLSPTVFRELEPRLGEWLAIKKEVDPENRFSSSLSRRLGLT